MKKDQLQLEYIKLEFLSANNLIRYAIFKILIILTLVIYLLHHMVYLFQIFKIMILFPT